MAAQASITAMCTATPDMAPCATCTQVGFGPNKANSILQQQHHKAALPRVTPLPGIACPRGGFDSAYLRYSFVRHPLAEARGLGFALRSSRSKQAHAGALASSLSCFTSFSICVLPAVPPFCPHHLGCPWFPHPRRRHSHVTLSSQTPLPAPHAGLVPQPTVHAQPAVRRNARQPQLLGLLRLVHTVRPLGTGHNHQLPVPRRGFAHTLALRLPFYFARTLARGLALARSRTLCHPVARGFALARSRPLCLSVPQPAGVPHPAHPAPLRGQLLGPRLRQLRLPRGQHQHRHGQAVRLHACGLGTGWAGVCGYITASARMGPPLCVGWTSINTDMDKLCASMPVGLEGCSWVVLLSSTCAKPFAARAGCSGTAVRLQASGFGVV